MTVKNIKAIDSLTTLKQHPLNNQIQYPTILLLLRRIHTKERQ